MKTFKRYLNESSDKGFWVYDTIDMNKVKGPFHLKSTAVEELNKYRKKTKARYSLIFISPNGVTHMIKEKDVN